MVRGDTPRCIECHRLPNGGSYTIPDFYATIIMCFDDFVMLIYCFPLVFDDLGWFLIDVHPPNRFYYANSPNILKSFKKSPKNVQIHFFFCGRYKLTRSSKGNV